MGEKYYFAYGSNLDKSQMEERVGRWIASERACVESYKLVFNVRSPRHKWNGWTANIKKTDVRSDIVYGVMYLITNEQLRMLTKCEGGREPTSISVILESGIEKNDVKAYIWPKEEASHEPPEDYKEAIIRGLTQHGYAQDIIEQVKRTFSKS